MPEEKDDEIRFRPTSGRILGSVAVIGSVVVLAIAVADPGSVPAPLAAGVALFGVLAWASMLWPRVSLTADDLVLRTMVEHQRLPLAAIEELAVRQVLAVRVGDKRYVSSALGRPLRKTMGAGGRKRADKAGADEPAGEVDYVDHVEQQLRDRMEQARSAAGVGLLSDEQLALAAGVRREPAWLPIGLIAVAVLALVASILR